jgi:hypothetical protein
MDSKKLKKRVTQTKEVEPSLKKKKLETASIPQEKVVEKKISKPTIGSSVGFQWQPVKE